MKKAIPLYTLSIFIGLLVISSNLQAATYKIDPSHSSVTFKVRHLVSKTQGEFKKFEGTINYDAKNPKNSSTHAVIQVGSVDTGLKKRDDHLRSKDFFNVAMHPKMTFETTKITKVKKKGTRAELVGKLTLNGVTKPVILDITFNGKAKDPFGGNERIGFTATTKIDRRDFRMTWNHEGEDGSLLVGNEVEIILELEGIKED